MRILPVEEYDIEGKNNKGISMRQLHRVRGQKLEISQVNKTVFSVERCIRTMICEYLEDKDISYSILCHQTAV